MRPRDRRGTSHAKRRGFDFYWWTRDSWSRQRGVIAKAEWTAGAANPRFVVTSLSAEDAASQPPLYEKIYCARGDMENRIKESIRPPHFGGDVRANQLRPVVCVHGLCAVARVTPPGVAAHPIRQGDLRHDPA